MTLDQYSTLLTLGIFAISGVIIAVTVLYWFVQPVKVYVDRHPYANFLMAIAFLSITSTIGALTYQLIYLTPVCELCWWQRIFFFPTSVIALVALWYRTRESHVTIGILSTFGLFYALYHYYYHFQGFVLGNQLTLPCSVGGLLPACTDSPILIFGFVTIPLMGVLLFLNILILTFFAQRAAKREGGLDR